MQTYTNQAEVILNCYRNRSHGDRGSDSQFHLINAEMLCDIIVKRRPAGLSYKQAMMLIFNKTGILYANPRRVGSVHRMIKSLCF